MLREDLEAPRKQRHTAKRVFERLRDEHDAQVSYSTVAKYVQRRRAEIAAGARAEAGSADGFVPQAKEPGAEAEVDFGDVTVELAGHLAKCLFAYRLSWSGRACHRVYACQAQEAFLEGHACALEATGGVPWRHVRYDNLPAAVAKVLAGRSRTETTRWLAFRSWYGFEAFYCEPGQAGAHEKGLASHCTSWAGLDTKGRLGGFAGGPIAARRVSAGCGHVSRASSGATRSATATGSSQCGQHPPMPTRRVKAPHSPQRWLPSERVEQLSHS